MNNLAERADPQFLKALKRLDIQSLENHGGSAYAFLKSGELVYYNPAWLQFAQANNGSKILRDWTIGSNIFDAIPDILQPYYNGVYQAIAELNSIKRPHQFLYECSSSDTVRHFSMAIYPLPEMDGFTAVNTLVNSLSRREPGVNLVDEASYRDEYGMIHQCAHCRRMQFNAPDGKGWHLITEWIDEIPEQCSHGLCPICFDYFYQSASRRRR